jgi:hypothetical protein
MKVMVLGKEHASGTSKRTGKDFDNTVVHVSFKKNRVDGSAVDSIWLDAKSYPVEDIQVGKTYDVDRDSRGYVLSFELAR